MGKKVLSGLAPSGASLIVLAWSSGALSGTNVILPLRRRCRMISLKSLKRSGWN